MSYAMTLRGMTPQQAADAVFPHSQVRGTAGFREVDYDNIVNAAAAGNFQSFNPTGCQGITPSGAKIVGTVGGLALTGLSTGLAIAGTAAALTAGITAGASLLVGLFTSIFAHHAAKVRQEQQIVCASVPAASDTLNAIDQAVHSGTITPAQGIQALQALESNFSQTVAPIIKMDSSHCNAACVWVRQLEAIVLKKSSDYQDMETVQQAKALPPAASSVTGSSATAPIASGVSSSTPGAVAQPVSGAPSTGFSTPFFGIPLWGWLAIAGGLFLVSER